MYLPPIESNCNYEPFVSGDVSIAPDAAIAPGVIIQAGQDGTIVIASGVCIGMGAILHAYEGTIEIEEGVTIGAGVLVVGQAKIAARACIGALTTLVNCDLQAQEMVAAGSIRGDRSRQVSENSPAVCTPSKEAEGTVCGVGARTAAAIDTQEQSEYLAPATRGNTFIEPKPISIPETATPVIEFELETTAPNNNTEEEAETTEAKFQYPSPGTGYATSLQPKPISIPQAATPVTNFEEEATTPTYTEEEGETAEVKFQYPSAGTGYATSPQPKPISIPQAATPVTNFEEEATTPTYTEEATGTPVTNFEEEATTSTYSEEQGETTEVKFQYPSPGTGFATSPQPKPISIPDPTANANNGANVPEAEAEASESQEEQKPQTAKPPVAGLDYVQSMMKTLFPHKNISLSSEDDED